MSMEVITTTDKNQRDRLFEDLRKKGNELERQVVKFSSNEPTTDADGNAGKIIYYSETLGATSQFRPFYRSTWSVAYPTS